MDNQGGWRWKVVFDNVVIVLLYDSIYDSIKALRSIQFSWIVYKESIFFCERLIMNHNSI